MGTSGPRHEKARKIWKFMIADEYDNLPQQAFYIVGGIEVQLLLQSRKPKKRYAIAWERSRWPRRRRSWRELPLSCVRLRS